MRKAIIITKDACLEQIRRYEAQKLFVFDDAVDLVSRITTKFEVEHDEENNRDLTVDPTLAKPPVSISLEQKIDKAIKYLSRRGFDEITLLINVHTSLSELLKAVALFQKYPRIKLEIEDEIEGLAYFKEGSYILSRGRTSSLSIYGFLSATISMDHVHSKISHMIVNETTHLSDIRLVQRIAVLKVEKGAVLVVRKWEKDDES